MVGSVETETHYELFLINKNNFLSIQRRIYEFIKLLFQAKIVL